MIFEVSQKLGGTFVDVFLDQQVNILNGSSGEGKTYLFNLLISYCTVNSISAFFFSPAVLRGQDMQRGSEQLNNLVLSNCGRADILFLDNADLYLTYELLEELKKTAKIIVVSMKNIINVIDEGYFCHIKYADSVLMLR
jgi:hypothetical protein